MIVLMKAREDNPNTKDIDSGITRSMKPWVDRFYFYGEEENQNGGWYTVGGCSSTNNKPLPRPKRVRETTQRMSSKEDVIRSIKIRNNWSSSNKENEDNYSVLSRTFKKIGTWILGY